MFKRFFKRFFKQLFGSAMSALIGGIALSLGALGLGAEGMLAMEPNARQLIQADEVLIIAHRGNSSVAPENTIPAFQSAVALHSDFVELDYYHSKDGAPVVFHDSNLDRTTNAIQKLGKSKIGISDLNLADLKQLDAGAWKGRHFRGASIPTLDEAMDVIQAGSMTLIERKGGDSATCVGLLSRRKCVDRVVVQSFDWQYVAECKKLAPELVVAALGSKELTKGKLDSIVKTGASVVGWNHKDIGVRQIRAAHAKGLRIWVYTVNDARRMEQLMKDGIDGIITDRPKLGLRVRSSLR